MKINKNTLLVLLILFFTGMFLSSCTKDSINYCGEKEDDGPWTDCDSERYDVLGPAERLLNKGVSRIIMIDLTVGGVRFAKTFDVVQMTKTAMNAWEAQQAEAASPVVADPNKIGVIFVVHGGFTTYKPQHLWDASTQMFSYDPNHPVNMLYLPNKNLWGGILSSGNAEKEVLKYAYEYEKLGGIDPFDDITAQQLQDMKDELDLQDASEDFSFEVDWAAWMAGEDVSHYAFPHLLYYPNDYEFVIPAPDPATPLIWVNDYTKLMERSFPADKNWTRSKGAPENDVSVTYAADQNPISNDTELAELQADGIEDSWSDAVSDNETAVLLLNHAVHDYNQAFDPKINDTIVLNENIKSILLERHPDMDPENIVGAFMGIKELNPENGKTERSREMRGENIGHAWLYETTGYVLPGDEWGYLYWDALEYFKDRGVKHIVIGFPQIITDSVLNLVEQHNQIAKEIGTQNWLYADTGDSVSYAGDGYPFADYWGIWVDTQCGEEECCFEMGGCEDGGVYPPPRQTNINSSMSDMDPYLAYDVCEYGHLGYEPSVGDPDKNSPVQDQYTGTWAYYRPPNDDPRVGKLLAKHVMNFVNFDTDNQTRK